MNNVTDLFMVTQFVQRLMMPFEEWPAYKAGIIDEKGNVIRKRATLKSSEKDSWGHFDTLVCNLKKILNKIPGGSNKLGAVAATVLLLKEDVDALADDQIEARLVEILENLNEEEMGFVNEMISKPLTFSQVCLDEAWTSEKKQWCDHCEKNTIHSGEMIEKSPIAWEHKRKCNTCGRDPNKRRWLRNQAVHEDAAVNAAGGGNIAGIGVGPDGEPGMGKNAFKKYKKKKALDTTPLLSRK